MDFFIPASTLPPAIVVEPPPAVPRRLLPQPVAAAEVPAATPVPPAVRGLIRVIVEILEGRRSITILDDVTDQVLTTAARAGIGKRSITVVRVRLQLRDDAVEAALQLRVDQHHHAAALQLRRRRGRWVWQVLELAPQLLSA